MKAFFFIVCLFLVSNLPAQNIGIGINNPLRSKLEVVGVGNAAGNTVAIFGTDGQGISFQRNMPAIGFNQYRASSVNGTYLNNGYAAVEHFDANNGTFAIDMLGTGVANTGTSAPTRAFTILNNGNTGIRISNPLASLHVARGTGSDGTIAIQSFLHWSHFNYGVTEDTYIRGGGSTGNVYINTSPGLGNVHLGGGTSKVGINAPGVTPVATLDINATAGYCLALYNEHNHNWDQQVFMGDHLRLNYRGINKGYFSSSGSGYVAVSDKRLKTNIQPLLPVLERVNRLNPLSYKMKDDHPSHQRAIGFIAQEVKSVFPEFVHVLNDHDRNGKGLKELHAMNYTGFFTISIKALQEQYQQIKSMEEENKLLLQKLDALEKKLIDK